MNDRDRITRGYIGVICGLPTFGKLACKFKYSLLLQLGQAMKQL